ncbi:MAG: tRNA (guanosine(37)-N1)-methyltransferase TrmD [Firmicutes bacterium]|nr:tRNA (guanosine(37)-N1)-methyltransferase TrmD [Bacillota bacterium]
MKITILTLFPQMFSGIEHSIIKRARENGKVEISLVDFREYTKDKHKKVDDIPYGGGNGMVIMAEPIVECIEAIDPKHQAHRIFLTPAAPTLTQKRVTQLSQKKNLLILCGHYEGVDQRAIDLCFDETISIGEYVLTGGEIAAMVLVDAVARYVDGVITKGSLDNESHTNGMLEHPQYTRPREYRGMQVPEVLLNGNHKEIEKWKTEQSEKITNFVKLIEKEKS